MAREESHRGGGRVAETEAGDRRIDGRKLGKLFLVFVCVFGCFFGPPFRTPPHLCGLLAEAILNDSGSYINKDHLIKKTLEKTPEI